MEEVTSFRAAPPLSQSAPSSRSAAVFKVFIMTSNAEYKGLLELVTPDGYVRLMPALAKWRAAGDEAQTFDDWRRVLENLKSVVDGLLGMALISGKPLVWPYSPEEAVETWGPGGGGPWKSRAYEVCWKALLEKATLLDKKTPLFKQCSEKGDWVRPSTNNLVSHLTS